jgi:biopolymer transport protein ExbD
MDFQTPQRPAKPESIVPMINVVFLLLIFFLMTAQIAPPEPFEVTAPEAEAAADPKGEITLYLSAAGVAQYQDHKDEAAFAVLQAEFGSEMIIGATGQPSIKRQLVLRADSKAKGARLAKVMSDLRRAGFASVELVVEVK